MVGTLLHPSGNLHAGIKMIQLRCVQSSSRDIPARCLRLKSSRAFAGSSFACSFLDAESSPDATAAASSVDAPLSPRKASLISFRWSSFSICPWRRIDSFRQLICPPSASRCLWAFNLAAWIDVLAYTKRMQAIVKAARGAVKLLVRRSVLIMEGLRIGIHTRPEILSRGRVGLDDSVSPTPRGTETLPPMLIDAQDDCSKIVLFPS